MIWDLRKRQSVYTVPAHTNLISHVKFYGKRLLKMVANSSKGSIFRSGFYSSTNSTSTLTTCLGQNVCFGEGWVGILPDSSTDFPLLYTFVRDL